MTCLENIAFMDLTPAWRNISVSPRHHEHQSISGTKTPATHGEVDA